MSCPYGCDDSTEPCHHQRPDLYNEAWVESVEHRPTRAVEWRRGADGAIAVPNIIYVDARGGHHLMPQSPYQRPPEARFAKCALCNERMLLTGDPTENHHNAMRHKTVCKGSSEAQREERARLIAEFERQPHVIAMRHAGYATEIRALRDPRPWWPEFVEKWIIARKVKARIAREPK